MALLKGRSSVVSYYDIIVKTDGTVVKDRYGVTKVLVLDDDGVPTHPLAPELSVYLEAK